MAEWGIEQARRYRRALTATCERIGEFPEIGQLEPGLNGDRSFVSQQHRIVYRITDRGVLILRFVHQRMDMKEIDLR